MELFSGYSSLGWWFLYFSALKMLFLSSGFALLLKSLSIFSHMNITHLFPSHGFSFLLFMSFSNNLIMVFLVMIFMFLLLIHWASWIYGFIIYPNFGIFCPLFLQIFSPNFFTSLLSKFTVRLLHIISHLTDVVFSIFHIFSSLDLILTVSITI